MKKGLTSVLEAAVFAATLAAVPACDDEEKDNEDAETGNEVGCPSTSTEAGCPSETEAGCPSTTEAGCPSETEAGCPSTTEAGCPSEGG